MTNPPKLDLQNLYAFALVAAELNIRRAAEALHIAQPPLSRKIMRLEKELGLALFKRHCRGLELTESGAEVLRLIEPLLQMENAVSDKLARLAGAESKPFAIGLTTAFEQGIFKNLIKRLQTGIDGGINLTRAPSSSLVAAVARGALGGAWIAMPTFAAGLPVMPTDYAEAIVAAAPAGWAVGEGELETLRLFNGRPFFWFAQRRNPQWHRYMKSVFRRIGFEAPVLEEPDEHDVLLARIAAEEGFALMPESFARIRRAGVVFRKVRDLPPLELAIVHNPAYAELFARYAMFAASPCRPGSIAE